jgi:hypothetical protein
VLRGIGPERERTPDPRDIDRQCNVRHGGRVGVRVGDRVDGAMEEAVLCIGCDLPVNLSGASSAFRSVRSPTVGEANRKEPSVQFRTEIQRHPDALEILAYLESQADVDEMRSPWLKFCRG